MQGPSRTEGDISVQVRSSDKGAAFWLTFEGTNRSHTRGVNRSAITEHVSQTSFVTSIPVTFDLQRGFQQGTPSIRATTQLTPVAVGSTVGGLRGRLVRRIAARRVESTNEQARQIAQRDTSRDVVAGFQQTVAKQLTDLNEEMDKNEVFAVLRESREPFAMRSGANYVELCFRPSSDGSIGTPPADQIGRREIELWVHGSVLNGRLPSVLEVYDRMRAGVGNLFSVLSESKALGLPRLSFADLGFFDWQVADDWIVLGTTSEEVEALVTLAQRIQNLEPSDTEVFTSAPAALPTAVSLDQRFYP